MASHEGATYETLSECGRLSVTRSPAATTQFMSVVLA